jgi:hypothetical protein
MTVRTAREMIEEFLGDEQAVRRYCQKKKLAAAVMAAESRGTRLDALIALYGHLERDILAKPAYHWIGKVRVSCARK